MRTYYRVPLQPNTATITLKHMIPSAKLGDVGLMTTTAYIHCCSLGGAIAKISAGFRQAYRGDHLELTPSSFRRSGPQGACRNDLVDSQEDAKGTTAYPMVVYYTRLSRKVCILAYLNRPPDVLCLHLASLPDSREIQSHHAGSVFFIKAFGTRIAGEARPYWLFSKEQILTQ